MKTGDKVLISPDLTKLPNWISGTVIEVENNPFVGIVISAETEDKKPCSSGRKIYLNLKITSVEIELPFYVFNILERQAKKEGITLKEYICKELEEYCKQSV